MFSKESKLDFVRNKKFSICYVLYIEENNPSSESDKLASVRTTLHSMKQSAYDGTVMVRDKVKDLSLIHI